MPFAAKEGMGGRAVINVNWFGARAYCRWAGKELPREEEWRLAARPAGGGRYPWGDESGDLGRFCNCGQARLQNQAGGVFPKDLSRVGCFDLAGNVAEWCADYAQKDDPSKRVVCGGSFQDSDPKLFAVTGRRDLDQVTYQRWVGFRGVVRLPVEKAEP